MDIDPGMIKEMLRDRTPEEVAAHRERLAEAARERAEEWRRKVDEDAVLAVPRQIELLRKEAQAKLEEAASIEARLTAYPDLRRQVGRWEKTAYYSRTVNQDVTDIDTRCNCGCCPDSPLEVWPYVNTPHGRVYSNPPCFTVGERCAYDEERDYIPYEGWETKLREAGIPEAVIERVQGHFKLRTGEDE